MTLKRLLIAAFFPIVLVCVLATTCSQEASAQSTNYPDNPLLSDALWPADHLGRSFIPGVILNTFTGQFNRAWSDFELPLQNGKRFPVLRSYSPDDGWRVFAPVLRGMFNSLFNKKPFKLSLPSGDTVAFYSKELDTASWALWMSGDIKNWTTRRTAFLSTNGQYRAICGTYLTGRSRSESVYNVSENTYEQTTLREELFGCEVFAPGGVRMRYLATRSDSTIAEWDLREALRNLQCYSVGSSGYRCSGKGSTIFSLQELGLGEIAERVKSIASVLYADGEAVGGGRGLQCS